ncbi:hypothetical protein J6590_012510 [Homalodisca vitripennis]|nr:hypothetical protein J6590_012510 [Homalodisca vitripennis]
MNRPVIRCHQFTRVTGRVRAHPYSTGPADGPGQEQGGEARRRTAEICMARGSSLHTRASTPQGPTLVTRLARFKIHDWEVQGVAIW